MRIAGGESSCGAPAAAAAADAAARAFATESDTASKTFDVSEAAANFAESYGLRLSGAKSVLLGFRGKVSVSFNGVRVKTNA